MRTIAESYVPWQENSFPGLLGNARTAFAHRLPGAALFEIGKAEPSLAGMVIRQLHRDAVREQHVVAGKVDPGGIPRAVQHTTSLQIRQDVGHLRELL